LVLKFTDALPFLQAVVLPDHVLDFSILGLIVAEPVEQIQAVSKSVELKDEGITVSRPRALSLQI
jgi:hypothetical protein